MATSAARIDLDEGAAPASPAASKVRVYAKSDGLVYSKDDAGVETLMSSGPAAGSGALDYVQITANVTISGTSEGAATTIITGTSQAYAAVPTIITVSCGQIDLGAHASGNTIVILLYDGATVLGRIGYIGWPPNSAPTFPFHREYRLTPTPATHQYIVKAWRTNANGTWVAGSGGSGTQLPSSLRITLA